MLNFSIPELYHGIWTYLSIASSSHLTGNIFLGLYGYMLEVDFYFSLDDFQCATLVKGLQLHYLYMRDRINGIIHRIWRRRFQWYNLWNLSFGIDGDLAEILKTVLSTVRTTCGVRAVGVHFSGDVFTLGPSTFPSLQVIHFFLEILSRLWEVSVMI